MKYILSFADFIMSAIVLLKLYSKSRIIRHKKIRKELKQKYSKAVGTAFLPNFLGKGRVLESLSFYVFK